METVNWEEVNAQVPKSEILNNIQDWAWCHPGSVPLPPQENKKISIPPQKNSLQATLPEPSDTHYFCSRSAPLSPGIPNMFDRLLACEG